MAFRRRRLFVVLITAAIVVGALLAFVFWPSGFSPPTLPKPNAYDVLRKAGAQVHPDTATYDEASPEELREIVAANEEILATARGALSQPCVVPVDWSINSHAAANAWLEEHYAESGDTRGVGRALLAAAKLASDEGRNEEAQRLLLDLLQFGRQIDNGGLMVDALVGLAYQRAAVEQLGQLAARLDEDQCAELQATLSEQEAPSAAPEEVLERESEFFRRSYGALQYAYINAMTGTLSAPAEKKLRDVVLSQVALVRLLRLDLALRGHFLDRGEYPTRLDELTTVTGSTAVRDVFPAADFRYVRTENGYSLYSVGPNGVDDGGVAGDSVNSGDLISPMTARVEAEESTNAESHESAGAPGDSVR